MCYTYISIYFNLGLFTNISARWPGSTHDSHVFRTSAIGIHLQNRYRGIDRVLLGDSGYPCRPFLLTSYRQPVEIKEQRFNSSHVSTRSTIERTFGIWKKRFNLMHSGVLWQAIFIFESIQKMRHFYGKSYNFEIYTILFSSNLMCIFAIDCDKGFR